MVKWVILAMVTNEAAAVIVAKKKISLVTESNDPHTGTYQPRIDEGARHIRASDLV